MSKKQIYIIFELNKKKKNEAQTASDANLLFLILAITTPRKGSERTAYPFVFFSTGPLAKWSRRIFAYGNKLKDCEL